MSTVTEEEGEIFQSWDEIPDIDLNLLRGIYANGFEKPSPIQSKSILTIKKGKNIIAQAQSGTGKTGSFVIGALTRVNLDENTNQVLIMVPTHELAKQIHDVILIISKMIINNIATLISK